MAQPEPWVSLDGAAADLKASGGTVYYRWVKHAELPASKVGRLWKRKLSDLDRWFRSAGPERPPTRRRSGGS